MIRRSRRSLPATLTALAVLAVCVLVATGAIQMLAGQRPLISYAAIAHALHGARWSDLAVGVSGGGAALLGLVVLLGAVLPGKATVLPLSDEGVGLDSGASRRSVRRTLRAAASSVDGVRVSRLALRRRKVTATVRTDRATTEGLPDAVRAALEHRLDQIAPATRPTVRVKVTTTRSAS
ncbi:DUF6286 domain-containing protein [Amycolatopsis anabasis]|uniref:DUF6286 domain-containing protein n=1 Tax=Amycolatopsis anabasis TaxID=1840409 RepID=UPI00131A77EC|nr:DUF6286 domain-containing protein [Amycolatopsis anabasis]